MLKKKQLHHFDILEARNAFKEGRNITELLRSQKSVNANSSEIIEASYDIQAGSYIDNIVNNPIKAAAYIGELTSILDKHLTGSDTLLDIGTGELTIISNILRQLENKPKSVFAFDISWSRIYKGIDYAKALMGDDYKRLKSFVADINEIPLLNKSINISTSSHALEPNGGKLKELLDELFRVPIDKLILFEP